MLHLLLAPLAAALHVCHSSLSRVRVALRPERGPVARCESAAKVHDQSTGAATPLEPPRRRTLPGTKLHSGAQTCSPPLVAASRTELPDAPELRRARAPPRRVLAGRALAGGSPCRAGLLRCRTTRVAARPTRARGPPQRSSSSSSSSSSRAAGTHCHAAAGTPEARRQTLQQVQQWQAGRAAAQQPQQRATAAAGIAIAAHFISPLRSALPG
jgi:hypothetical protein